MGNKLSHKYKPNKHEKAWEIPDDTSSSEDETLDKKSGKRKKKTKKGKSKQKNIGKGNARSKKTSMRAKTKGKSNEADEEELSWGHPKIIITSPSDVEASFDETPKKETSVNCSSSPASGQKDADVPEASETLEAIVEIVETSEEVQDSDEKEAEKTVEEIIALVSSVKSAETCEKPDLSEVSMHVNDNTQHSTDVHDTPDNTPTTEDVVIDKPVITLADVAHKGIRTDEESVAMETTDNRERIEKVEANIVTAVMPNSDIIYMEEVAVKPGTGNTENSKNDNMKIVTENDLQNDEVNKLKGLSIVPNIENKEENVDTQNKLNDTIVEDDLQNVRIEDDLQKKDDPKNVKKDDHQNKGDIKNFQKDDLQKEVNHQNKDEHQKVQKDEVNKLSGSTIEPGKVNCDSFQPVLIEACCSGIRTDQQDACNQPKLESDTDVLVEESNVVTVELGSSAVVCMEEVGRDSDAHNSDCDVMNWNVDNVQKPESESIVVNEQDTTGAVVEKASPGVIVNPLIMRSESSSSVDEDVTPEEMNIHHQESQMLKEQDAWEKEEIKKREQLKRIRDVEEKENIQIEQPVTNGGHQEHEVSFTYPPPKSAPPVATKPSYKQLSNTPPSLVSYKPQAPPSSAPPVVDNKHVDRMSFRDRRKYFEQEIKHQADDTGSIGRRKKISLVSDQDLRTIKQEEEKKYGTLSKEDIRKSMDIDEEDEEMVEDMADISTRVDPDASIVIEGKEYKVEKRPQKLSARERLTPQFSVPVTASSEEDLIRSLEKDVKRASCIEDRDATPSALNERLKVTSPEVKRDARGGHDLSPAERRALEAEKRKQWRQERFKSLEADALQAQMVMTKEKMKGRRSEGSFNATDKQQPAMT